MRIFIQLEVIESCGGWVQHISCPTTHSRAGQGHFHDDTKKKWNICKIDVCPHFCTRLASCVSYDSLEMSVRIRRPEFRSQVAHFQSVHYSYNRVYDVINTSLIAPVRLRIHKNEIHHAAEQNTASLLKEISFAT